MTVLPTPLVAPETVSVRPVTVPPRVLPRPPTGLNVSWRWMGARQTVNISGLRESGRRRLSSKGKGILSWRRTAVRGRSYQRRQPEEDEVLADSLAKS